MYKDKSIDHATVQFFSNNINELPSVYKVGDIVRIHRVNASDYKGNLQLNANLHIHTSWLIFSGNPEYYHSYEHPLPDQGSSNLSNPSQFSNHSNLIVIADSPEEEAELLKQQRAFNQPPSNFLDLISSNSLNRDEMMMDSIEVMDQRYYPIASSHNSYSFNDREKQIIDDLRNWSQNYLKSVQIYSTETNPQTQPIYQNNEGNPYFNDFDIMAKLISVNVLDSIFTIIKMKDLAGIVYQLKVNTSRHKIPQKGQVIRIRSAKVFDAYQANVKGNSEDPVIIQFHNPSNILHIPAIYKQALLMNERVLEDDFLKKLILSTEQDKDITMCSDPIVISNVSQQYSEMYFTTLNEVFHMPTGSSNSAFDYCQTNIFRVKVFTLGFMPNNIREMCQLYCNKCVKTYSFQEIETDNTLPLDKQPYMCLSCGDQCKSIYMIVLVVKDDSTSYNDKCYKLYYYSHDQQEGDELFGGLKASNLYKDTQTRDMLAMYIQTFTKFNVHLDLVIRRKFSEQLNENVYQIIDGKTKAFHLELLQNQQFQQKYQQKLQNEQMLNQEQIEERKRQELKRYLEQQASIDTQFRNNQQDQQMMEI
eukprot:403374850